MPKEQDDCYYFFNSSCSKGDECGFRHSEAALGCETVCVFWKSGSCVRPDCRFRHSIVRPSDPPSDRSRTFCYFESQAGGCQKPHCPFRHRNPHKRLPVSETAASAATTDASDSIANNDSTPQTPTEQKIPATTADSAPDAVPAVPVEQISFHVTTEDESDPEDERRRSGKQTHAADGIVVKSLEQIRMERLFKQGDVSPIVSQKRQSVGDEDEVRDKSQTKRVRLTRRKADANGQHDQTSEEKTRTSSLTDDLLNDLLDGENDESIDCNKDEDILQEIHKIINS